MNTGWGKKHYWRRVGLSYEAACGCREFPDFARMRLTDQPPEVLCLKCSAMSMSTQGWSEDGAWLQVGLYYNANGFAVAVVAVVKPFVDWAAYIGGTDLTEHEEDAVRWVARYGVHLPRNHAEHFFPHLPKKLYRI